MLNQGIGRTSQKIADIDKQLNNQDLTKKETLSLIGERTLYYNVRKGYYKRLDEITDTRNELNNQKEQLIKAKTEITEE